MIPDKCDVHLCEREGVYEWQGIVDARYAPVLDTRCRFMYCDEHDKWVRNERSYLGEPVTPRYKESASDQS